MLVAEAGGSLSSRLVWSIYPAQDSQEYSMDESWVQCMTPPLLPWPSEKDQLLGWSTKMRAIFAGRNRTGLVKKPFQGYRDGSGVKSIDCSSIIPGFSLTGPRRSDSSWPPLAPGLCIVHRYYMQAKHPYMKQIYKKQGQVALISAGIKAQAVILYLKSKHRRGGEM